MSESATEALRRMLDERGVEWTYSDGTVSYADNERWFHAWAYSNDEMFVSMGYLTPEQAISTTLGGKLTAEQVRDAVKRGANFDYGEFGEYVSRENWQAIADELNAALGGGECEFVGDAKRPPKCSACGWQTSIYDCEWLEDGEYEYDGNFCKECGAKVKAVKR